MGKNAIIFDLDGTLWDVTQSTYMSANLIASKYSLEKIDIETIKKGFGTNKEESAKLYFPNIELKESLNYIYEIGTINLDLLNTKNFEIFKDEIEILKSLSKEYDLFIVSNTSRNEYIEAYLNNSGAKDFFKGFIAASSLDLTKGEAIKKIIIDYNIEKAVYVGDTLKDQIAAKEAEITFIQAKYGFGDNLNSEYSINEITKLPTVLKSIF